MVHVALLLSSVFVGGARAPLPARYSCGACLVLEEHPLVAKAICVELDACHLLDAALAGCVRTGLCAASTPDEGIDSSLSPVQLRITKGFGSRPYNSLRASVITRLPDKPPVTFDYSHPFQHRWREFALHSSLVTASPGAWTNLSLGPTLTARLWLPAQGAPVVGVLIADPCVRFASVTSLVDCTFAEKWQTAMRTPALLNAFLAHNDVIAPRTEPTHARPNASHTSHLTM